MERCEVNRRRREQSRRVRGSRPKQKRDLIGEDSLRHVHGFLSNIHSDEGGGCSWWIGGYQTPDEGSRTPMFFISGKHSVKARAFAWASQVGMTKQGYVPHLRSKCRNPCCVNPDHMRRGDDFPYTIGKAMAGRLLVAHETDGESLGSIAFRMKIPETTIKAMLDCSRYGNECMDRVYSIRKTRKIDV